jgi:hypothetical protein
MSNHDGKPNRLIADHGDWQEWDISTSKYPNAVLKIDTADMLILKANCTGRIYAFMGRHTLYAYFYTKDGRRIVHRSILGAKPGTLVDHANHDGLDNRRCNIRLATSADNNANRVLQKNNTSGVVGVVWHKHAQRWQAQIKKNRKMHYLGLFKELSDAIAARRSAEQEHFGEFAYAGAQS